MEIKIFQTAQFLAIMLGFCAALALEEAAKRMQAKREGRIYAK